MKIESLNKQELIKYCRQKGIKIPTQIKKEELIKLIQSDKIEKINLAIKEGKVIEMLRAEVNLLSEEYASQLKIKINLRKEEMKNDDTSHYIIYRVLGITSKEGQLIDEYQNIGRFLYNYAGSFLEEVASLCLLFHNPQGKKTTVQNMISKTPKTFEIDFLDHQDAIEIKWRDATTDGDHITKEHTRVKVIEKHGYKPIRVMFYDPQREQAITIQETLKTVYKGVNGEYYAGEEAWNFIKTRTGFELKQILIEIAEQRTPEENNGKNN
jgi:hypothetical protein